MRKDENNNIPAGFKLLQLSSFAQLDKAQIYWQELVAADPALAAYSPIIGKSMSAENEIQNVYRRYGKSFEGYLPAFGGRIEVLSDRSKVSYVRD